MKVKKCISVLIFLISIIIAIIVYFDINKNIDIDIKKVDEIKETEKKVATKSVIDKITFFGDIIISDRTMKNYDENGITKILDDSMKNVIESSDLCIANLECVLTDNDEEEVNKKYNFKVPTKYVSLLNDLKIDLLSLANNHILDYGIKGLESTINVLDQNNINHIGAGMNNKEARKAYIKNINDKTYAILSASQVFPDDTWSAREDNPGVSNGYGLIDIVKEIQDIRSSVDKIIVYMHWGIELDEKSNSKQNSAAKVLARAGADVIIGTHTHTVEEVDFIDGVPVVYSIGNFVYGGTMRDALVVEVYFDYSEDENGKVIVKCLPSVSGYEKVWIKENEYGKKLKLIELQNKSENCIITDDGIIIDKSQFNNIIASWGEIEKNENK